MDFTKFFSRSLNRDLCRKVDEKGWYCYIKLSPESRNDLIWFRDNIVKLNGCEMVVGEEACVFDVFFAGDLSSWRISWGPFP